MRGRDPVSPGTASLGLYLLPVMDTACSRALSGVQLAPDTGSSCLRDLTGSLFRAVAYPSNQTAFPEQILLSLCDGNKLKCEKDMMCTLPEVLSCCNSGQLSFTILTPPAKSVSVSVCSSWIKSALLPVLTIPHPHREDLLILQFPLGLSSSSLGKINPVTGWKMAAVASQLKALAFFLIVNSLISFNRWPL